MTSQFEKIATAIDYLNQHFKSQPSLEELANHVHLSPFHFQRLFQNWAGTTPKKFLQYITLNHAKELLKSHSISVWDTAMEVGLSGSSRLHDLFITIEGMTPGEYKKGGESLNICYSFSSTPFGEVIVASTDRGICYLSFYEQQTIALQCLYSEFPNATLLCQSDIQHHAALKIFEKDWRNLDNIKLHLKGSPFQLKVWESLLKIPSGQLCTYGDIATLIGQPHASRAVGNAIGHNLVAYLIPCHRVIQKSGLHGGYHWGNTRKTAMIGWEAAQINI